MKIIVNIGVFMGACQKWRQKIKNSGFRLTVPRQSVIAVLEKSEGHLSAEDIYMAVHPTNRDIGLTTIYRTLDLLEETGIVTKFDFGHGKSKYELSEEYGNKKHHHHLLCIKCRKIIDYSDFFDEELEYIREATIGLKKKYNFEICNHMINFYGMCPDCKKETRRKGDRLQN
jgi:Fur family ferric uptake transcriptional regulator